MELLTAAEAALELDVTRQRVYQWITEGRMRVARTNPYLIRSDVVGKFDRRPPGRQSK